VNHSRQRLDLISVVLLVALAGCGGGAQYDGPPRSAITGTVTVDGKPLTSGTIGFVGGGTTDRSASAPIADGVYSIPEVQGPTFGSYLVVISGTTSSEETQESEEESPAGEDAGVEGDEEESGDESEGSLSAYVSAGNTLPAKYNTETELSREIESSSHTFDFDLTTN
jgi:hypothetical protein